MLVVLVYFALLLATFLELLESICCPEFCELCQHCCEAPFSYRFSFLKDQAVSPMLQPSRVVADLHRSSNFDVCVAICPPPNVLLDPIFEAETVQDRSTLATSQKISCGQANIFYMCCMHTCKHVCGGSNSFSGHCHPRLGSS